MELFLLVLHIALASCGQLHTSLQSSLAFDLPDLLISLLHQIPLDLCYSDFKSETLFDIMLS